MRVTTKGQVTIPQHVREKLGITPATEIDFIEEKGKNITTRRFQKLRGIATVKMTTDEIIALTRGDN